MEVLRLAPWITYFGAIPETISKQGKSEIVNSITNRTESEAVLPKWNQLQIHGRSFHDGITASRLVFGAGQSNYS